MKKNNKLISGIFPLASHHIGVASNSKELMDFFFKNYHCQKFEFSKDNKISLSFKIHKNESGVYILYCSAIEFRMQIDNINTEEKNWCVIEAIKIISQYYFTLKGTLFLHGSATNYENKGYIFSGIAGSGKSTISDNMGLKEKFADDQVIVEKKKGKYLVYSTVFDQKLKTPNFNGIQLGGIFFIGQSLGLEIKPLLKIDKILQLLMTNDLHNSVFEFYLNQSQGDKRLHSTIAKKLFTLPFRNEQLKLYLSLIHEIGFYHLLLPRNIAKKTLFNLILKLGVVF